MADRLGFWLVLESAYAAAEDIGTCQPKQVSRSMQAVGQTDIIGILHRNKLGFEIGKNVIKGYELTQVPDVPVGSHSWVGAPVPQHFLRTRGAGRR